MVVLPTLRSVWIADGVSANDMTTIHWRRTDPFGGAGTTATPQPPVSLFCQRGNVKARRLSKPFQKGPGMRDGADNRDLPLPSLPQMRRPNED